MPSSTPSQTYGQDSFLAICVWNKWFLLYFKTTDFYEKQMSVEVCFQQNYQLTRTGDPWPSPLQGVWAGHRATNKRRSCDVLGRTGTQHSPGLNPVPKLNTSPSYRQRFNAPPLNLIASALFPFFRQGFQKKAYKEKKAGSYSVLIVTKRNCILPSYWNLPQGSVVVFLVFCKKEKKKKRLKIAIASAQQMWSLKKSHAGAWLAFTTGAQIIWVATLVTTLQVTARPILWWKYGLNLCYIWENVTSHL